MNCISLNLQKNVNSLQPDKTGEIGKNRVRWGQNGGWR